MRLDVKSTSGWTPGHLTKTCNPLACVLKQEIQEPEGCPYPFSERQKQDLT
jgi:hypothetical protein